MAVEFLLQEAYELVTAANDMAGLNGLQLKNHIGVDDLAQLLEGVLPKEREVAPRQALALDDPCCAVFRDAGSMSR